MKKYHCCFTGHRIIKKEEFESIKSKLKDTIIKLINNNIITFICGGALGFDTLAALEVLEQKKIYKNISLIMVLPCKNQNKNWKKKD